MAVISTLVPLFRLFGKRNYQGKFEDLPDRF